MIRTKFLIALAITALAIVSINCGKPSVSNGGTTNTTTSNADAGGPTAAYKAAYEARKSKDVAKLKTLMSKDILEFFTMLAGTDSEGKQTVDDLLKELCDRPQAEKPETRGEKIQGTKASVEYVDEKGGWQQMDFVKEDGAWKLTIDKPTPPPPSGESNSNSTNTNVNAN